MSSVDIQGVTEAHLPAILEILNREILEGYAHFGLEPILLDDLRREFAAHGTYPWTAATEEGQLSGFARANPWKSRGAYSQTCEVGVYVRPECQGRGIARCLYEVFLEEVRRAGFHTALGGIALPNPASVRLHEGLGFHQVGTLPQVGFKHGEWRDVGYWAIVFD